MTDQNNEERNRPSTSTGRHNVFFYPQLALVPPPVIDFNNCATKCMASIVGGAAMGMLFGPIFSSSLTSVDLDEKATFRQKVVSVSFNHPSL